MHDHLAARSAPLISGQWPTWWRIDLLAVFRRLALNTRIDFALLSNCERHFKARTTCLCFVPSKMPPKGDKKKEKGATLPRASTLPHKTRTNPVPTPSRSHPCCRFTLLQPPTPARPSLPRSPRPLNSKMRLFNGSSVSTNPNHSITRQPISQLPALLRIEALIAARAHASSESHAAILLGTAVQRSARKGLWQRNECQTSYAPAWGRWKRTWLATRRARLTSPRRWRGSTKRCRRTWWRR